jgi:hypothetical protein
VDQLEKFCNWFLKNTPVLGAVPFTGAVSKIQDVTAILLYRKDQFQVYVGGNINFSHSGKYTCPKEEVFGNDGPLKLCNRRGERIRVRPNDLHGGIFGEGGGVFLSVQHWLNGVKPHCVAADYNGVTMGDDHLAKVVCGEASAKPQLTEQDAARLEA